MKGLLRTAACVLLITIFGLSPIAAQSDEGNPTMGGVNGYLVIPSALPVASTKNATITTGYSAIYDFSKGFAHIPYIQFGFAHDFEASLAVDIADKADMLLNAKWRFLEKGTTSLSFGVVGQMLEIGKTPTFAAQTYLASTFNSTFISWPSKTTLLVGYTFDNSLNTDIDFGMGFQAPLFKKLFKGNVDFLIDFGNISYSKAPSGGNPTDRGMLNIGMRLLPVEFMQFTFVAADLRVIDILDHSGRAVSAGISISFRPRPVERPEPMPIVASEPEPVETPIIEEPVTEQPDLVSSDGGTDQDEGVDEVGNEEESTLETVETTLPSSESVPENE